MRSVLYPMGLWAAVVLGVIAVPAKAARHDELITKAKIADRQIDIRPGHSYRFEVPGGLRHIEKLYISAESFHGSSTMQIYVNGDEKARVFVPNRDPWYLVTIGEAASYIEIKNQNGPGTLVVREMKGDLSFHSVTPLPFKPVTGYSGTGFEHPAQNLAARFGREAARVVDALRDHSDPETEYIVHLLPIKRVAGKVIAIANAHGTMSSQTRNALMSLANQIAFATNYIESSFKVPATFELATRLLQLRHEIEDALN